MLTIRPARIEDIGPVCADLREWDEIECAIFGTTASDYMHAALTGAFRHRCQSLVAPDGMPLCIGGRTAHNHDTDWIWLLGTNRLRLHRRAFLLASRRYVDSFVRGGVRVMNVIPEGRAESVAWLRWLGFDFGAAFMHESGIRLLPFWMDPDTRPDAGRRPLTGHPRGF